MKSLTVSNQLTKTPRGYEKLKEKHIFLLVVYFVKSSLSRALRDPFMDSIDIINKTFIQ
jgi:hypothetical protein